MFARRERKQLNDAAVDGDVGAALRQTEVVNAYMQRSLCANPGGNPVSFTKVCHDQRRKWASRLSKVSETLLLEEALALGRLGKDGDVACSLQDTGETEASHSMAVSELWPGINDKTESAVVS